VGLLAMLLGLCAGSGGDILGEKLPLLDRVYAWEDVMLLLCCPGSLLGQGLCPGGKAEEAGGPHCRWECVCRARDVGTGGCAEAVGCKVWAGCTRWGARRC